MKLTNALILTLEKYMEITAFIGILNSITVPSKYREVVRIIHSKLKHHTVSITVHCESAVLDIG